jgi:hypothetical protein
MERSFHGPSYGTIPAFSWKNAGRTTTTTKSFRIANI